MMVLASPAYKRIAGLARVFAGNTDVSKSSTALSKIVATASQQEMGKPAQRHFDGPWALENRFWGRWRFQIANGLDARQVP
ncbi:MAG: hypothetical protein FWG10_04985 [Eubacteriaceae bacterium]|nr:hypothetical protein [Eubacteriaceae bacterium]